MTIGLLSAEPAMIRFFGNTMKEYRERRCIEIQTEVYGSVKAFFDADHRADLVFVDDGVDHKTCLESARMIRNGDGTVALVLLSATKDPVFDAFSVQAHRFLVKPIAQSLLFEAVDSFRRERNSVQLVIVKVGHGYQSIRSEEIIAVEANGKECKIHMEKGVLPVNTSYAQTVLQLPKEYFYSVHRSYTVNMNEVRSFDAESLTLSNGLHIPVSRRRKIGFFQTYSQFVKGHNFS